MKKLKSITVFLVLLGLSLVVSAQTPAPKEKIKSIIVTEEKYDMLVKKQFTESESYYDANGNMIEDKTFKQGKLDKHFRYQYDNNNNKIREEELDSSDKIIEYSEYKYENGMRVEKTVFDGNKKAKSKKFYKYTSY